MRMLTFICMIALVAACDRGNSYVVRSKVNGQWQIDARTRVHAGIATFECLHSASGRCHFTVFGAACAPASAGNSGCSAHVLKQFSLAVNARQAWPALPDFRLCVSHRPDAVRSDCSAAGRADKVPVAAAG